MPARFLLAATALALTSPAVATAPVSPPSKAAQALQSELDGMVAARAGDDISPILFADAKTSLARHLAIR